MHNLRRLAELISTRNVIDRDIAVTIGRPALIGHVGEYIASHVFGITLEESAAHKGSDGRFTDGDLAERTVNIKFYAKREGLLDLSLEGIPDYYLVLTGPKSAAASSRAGHRPWVIDSVFLFDAPQLHQTLSERGVKRGIATSVANTLWNEAQIYPDQRSKTLILSDDQQRLLALFSATISHGKSDDLGPHR